MLSFQAPVISSAWSRVMQAQCEDAVYDAIDQYKREMNSRIHDYMEGSESFRQATIASPDEYEKMNLSIVDHGQGNVARFDEFGNLKKFVQADPTDIVDMEDDNVEIEVYSRYYSC